MSIVKDMFLAEALGGGGSSYTLLGSKEFEVSTTSTSVTDVGSFNVPGVWTKDVMIYIKVRDKAGKRQDYWVSHDSIWINYKLATGTNAITTHGSVTIGKNLITGSSDIGVYPASIQPNDDVIIKSKYSSAYGTIDGTYVVEVYALPWPKDDSPLKEATA